MTRVPDSLVSAHLYFARGLGFLKDRQDKRDPILIEPSGGHPWMRLHSLEPQSPMPLK